MPTRHELPFDANLKETLDALHGPGLLLVTQGAHGKPNAMTIGWGSVGVIWGLPVFQVLVRPSRHTFSLLEANPDFTVNLMPADQADALHYCGTMSGRDVDKFAQLELTPVAGRAVAAPYVQQSTLVYECRTVLTAEVNPDRLDARIIRGSYKSGDFHRIYFGQILATHARG